MLGFLVNLGKSCTDITIDIHDKCTVRNNAANVRNENLTRDFVEM